MPVSKNAYKRYLIIHNILKRPPYLATKKRILGILEDEGYGISPSMFEKDLETLRVTFDLPIEYSRQMRGYYYTESNASFDLPMDDEVVKTIYGALN